MRIIGRFSALATFGALIATIATMAAPSAAQIVVDQKLDACGLSLSFLSQIRDGADAPKGVEIHPRLKAENGYKTELEKQLYLFDGYREFGDVRANCKPEQWPAEVKVENLKGAVQAAVKASPEKFCAAGDETNPTPAWVIPKWMADPQARWFEDRVLELGNQLDTLDARHETIDRHLSDSEWLRDAARELVATCKPDSDVKKAFEAAELSLKIAQEHDAFRDCVKARDQYKPAMTAFDGAVKTQDAKAMKVAYAALEKAAKPVKTACKPSEEGVREIDYILASRKMQISFVEVPGCRDAAKAMNDQRQQINTTAKPNMPAAIKRLREISKDASRACKNDPAPKTWGEFVAWITEKNLTRIP